MSSYVDRFFRLYWMLAFGAMLGIGLYMMSLPDTVMVTGVREIHVVNSAGVNNLDRHFNFDDGCVLEVGGRIEQAAFTGDVRLMMYTPPRDSASGNFCPSGTHFVAFADMYF